MSTIDLTNSRMYCLGFMFDISPKNRRVVLIEKKRPDWQIGMYNGIGGHIEDGETAYEAMTREFEEEAGLSYNEWEHIGLRQIVDEKGDLTLHIFRAFTNLIDNVRTETDETVHQVFIRDLQDIKPVLAPSLSYLIPMCLDKNIKHMTTSEIRKNGKT